MGLESRTSLLRKWNARSRGQAAVIVAMAFVGLLVAVGLAVDGGILFLHRVWLREAADAAALAGAYELPNENAACARVVEYLLNHDYTPGDDFEFQVIFPEPGEVDDFPAVPTSPTRVLNSPSISDCSGLTIAGDHQQVWVTADQQVKTVFMGLVGINNVGTGIPAVALKPEQFDIVFAIPDNSDLRHDTCDYNKSENYTQGTDFFGDPYGCTSHNTGVSIVDAIVNGGFEDDSDGDGIPDGWEVSYEDEVSLSDDNLRGDHSAALENTQNVPNPWCNTSTQNGCADLFQTITTNQTHLYLGFWVKAGHGMHNAMEVINNNNDMVGVNLRWDSTGDGVVDSAPRFYPRIVQFCEWYGNPGGVGPCRFCPDQQDACEENPWTDEGDDTPTQCPAIFRPTYVVDDWVYTVVEVPSEAWAGNNDTIEIRFVNLGNDDDSEAPPLDSDLVLIDDVTLYSAPWKQGPSAIYQACGDSDGRASCYTADTWPNCDDYYNDMGNTDPSLPYGSNFVPPREDTIPDILFPARELMQQPLYDMLLAVGNDSDLNPGPPSFMEMLGPGQSFGYVLYQQHTYLVGCNGEADLNTNYDEFRYGRDDPLDPYNGLFNGVSSYSWDMGCPGGGGEGYNVAQALAAARKKLAEGARENTTKVIVLYATQGANVRCGLNDDTYCYGQQTCVGQPQSCIDAAEADAERQIQFAIADGITVFTIGIGQHADMDLLQRLAEPTGGTWHHVMDNSQLSATFQQVYEEMQQIVRLTH
jgi:hypothetical protein